MNTHTFIKKVFSNGLTVILIPRKESPTSTVLVLVEAGSKYETKKINGISHFLEHMCFKGTKRRPRSSDISGELDALGAQYNAFTGHEYTGYYAKVDPGHIGRALDIVADIYQNQIFRDAEIKRESGVIVEEINMYEDNPQRKIHDNLTALLYGNQPAGWNIAGTKKTVRGITKKHLKAYRAKHYVASATTVIVAGSFNEKNMLADIRKHFSGIRNTRKHKKEKVVERQKKPELSLEHKKTDQSHMIIGIRTFPHADPRAYALEVLATALGGGMSSRLFELVREKLGAAYYIYASNDLYTDHGYLMIGTGVGNGRAKEVLSAILKECTQLKNVPMTDKELSKVKDYLVGKLYLGLETTDQLAWFYGQGHVLEKKIETPEMWVKKLRAVTADDVQHLARELLKKKNLNFVSIGPERNKEEFSRILHLAGEV